MRRLDWIICPWGSEPQVDSEDLEVGEEGRLCRLWRSGRGSGDTGTVYKYVHGAVNSTRRILVCCKSAVVPSSYSQ